MKHPPTAERARISEIFSSLQGEGPRMGERHIFLRFEECHIHCKYCDELDKVGVETSLEAAVEAILLCDKKDGPHRFISYTGGEPLLYLKFLKPLMQRMREHGFKNYLETDGILYPALEQAVDLCDCIAMDLKPPSVTGEKDFAQEHEKFLKIAVQKDTFIKIVLSNEIDTGEFDKLIDIVVRTAPDLTVVLQPLSGTMEGIYDTALMNRIMELQKRASKNLADVRIMPRFHKLIGVR